LFGWNGVALWVTAYVFILVRNNPSQGNTELDIYMYGVLHHLVYVSILYIRKQYIYLENFRMVSFMADGPV
jgi:hypothetical protein